MVLTSKLAESFAINLRFYCNQKSSIAQVCRETEIHRQQFNKYLSGSSFPNAHNLSKICRHLDIAAEKMFVEVVMDRGLAQSDRRKMQSAYNREMQLHSNILLQSRNDGFKNLGRNLLNESCVLNEGSYYCYFPFSGPESFFLRTYVRVWNCDGHVLFSRITRIRQPDESGNLIARGHHIGNVVQSKDEVSFIGHNKQPPHQISLINLDCKSTFNGYYFGLAITRAAGNSMACRVAMEYLGAIRPNRKIIGALGVVQSIDNSVPKQIRLALSQKENFTQHVMFPPSSDEIFASLVK